MAITLAQAPWTATNDSSALSIALAATSVSAGSLIVVVAEQKMGSDEDPVSGIADDIVGAYTFAVYNRDNGSSGANATMYYYPNHTGGSATITATFKNNQVDNRIIAWEFAGAATASPLDQTAGADNTTGAPDPGTITPTVAGSVIVAAACCQQTGYTVDAAFTEAPTEFATTTAVMDGIYEIQSGTTARTTFWSAPTGGFWTAVAANFKAAAAAGVGIPIAMHHYTKNLG